MMCVHAQCEELVPSLGAAQLDLRGFAHFDRRERLAAVVQRDGGDFVARPFDHFVQIVKRLAVKRNRDTASATATGSLRGCVETMMSRNDPTMRIELWAGSVSGTTCSR